MKKRERLYPYLLLSPTFLLVALVSVYPIVISFIYAFSDMHYLEFHGFIGLKNFSKLANENFIPSGVSIVKLKNTISIRGITINIKLHTAYGYANHFFISSTLSSLHVYHLDQTRILH